MGSHFLYAAITPECNVNGIIKMKRVFSLVTALLLSAFLFVPVAMTTLWTFMAQSLVK